MAQAQNPPQKYGGALEGLEGKVDTSAFDPVLYTRKLYESAPLRMTYRAQDRKLLNNGDITGRVASLPQTPPTLAEFVPAPQARQEIVIAS